jgi:hypothetical protein
MTRIVRSRSPRFCLVGIFLVVVTAGVGSAAASGAATPTAEAVLAGRLGGTLASFEARYGMPRAGTPEDGADFAVAGYGSVFVQFKFAPDPTRPNRVLPKATPDSPAMVITLRAPRPETAPSTAPDPADWSLVEARTRAARFLPRDAELGDEVAGDGAASLPCRSEALARVFGAAAAGGCRVGFVLPTPQTVSYVTLALAPGGDAVDTGPTNPCAGAVAWSQDAGARMAAAQDVLDRVAAVADDDPDAPATLRRLGEEFAQLAAEQRAAAVPPALAAANDRLVAAFAGYASAVAAAAEGVAAGDAARVDAAVQAIADANAAVGQATAAIRRALAGCGLTPGTPTAA